MSIIFKVFHEIQSLSTLTNSFSEHPLNPDPGQEI